jgi:hypothetical protein
MAAFHFVSGKSLQTLLHQVSAKPFHGSEGLAGVNQVAHGTHQQLIWGNGDIIMQENNYQNSAHAPSPSDLQTGILLVWFNVL